MKTKHAFLVKQAFLAFEDELEKQGFIIVFPVKEQVKDRPGISAQEQLMLRRPDWRGMNYRASGPGAQQAVEEATAEASKLFAELPALRKKRQAQGIAIGGVGGGLLGGGLTAGLLTGRFSKARISRGLPGLLTGGAAGAAIGHFAGKNKYEKSDIPNALGKIMAKNDEMILKHKDKDLLARFIDKDDNSFYRQQYDKKSGKTERLPTVTLDFR